MVSFKKITFLFLFLLVKISLFAQCAMCKATIESDLATGGTTAKGINNGILYLMIIPFILVGAVGYLIYKNNQTETS